MPAAPNQQVYSCLQIKYSMDLWILWTFFAVSLLAKEGCSGIELLCLAFLKLIDDIVVTNRDINRIPMKLYVVFLAKLWQKVCLKNMY